MKHASRRQPPELNTLRFTKGMAQADPKNIVGFPAEVCELE
jgi:hypothetical protein